MSRQASNPNDIAEVIYDLVKDLDFIEKEKLVTIIAELVKLHAENRGEATPPKGDTA